MRFGADRLNLPVVPARRSRLMTRLLHGVGARVLACVLLFFVVPGVEEWVSDAVHVVLDGHTFHDQGHEEPDHCCSGAFHFCGCHALSPAVPVVFASVLGSSPPGVLHDVPRPRPAGAPRDAHARRMIRPPTA